MLVLANNARRMVPKISMAGSALRCKGNLSNCYELGDLLSRANAIRFKQETGTLHYNTVPKGPTTKQKEIKKTTAFFLEIVSTEKDDLTLRECILIPLRDKILEE